MIASSVFTIKSHKSTIRHSWSNLSFSQSTGEESKRSTRPKAKRKSTGKMRPNQYWMQSRKSLDKPPRQRPKVTGGWLICTYRILKSNQARKTKITKIVTDKGSEWIKKNIKSRNEIRSKKRPTNLLHIIQTNRPSNNTYQRKNRLTKEIITIPNKSSMLQRKKITKGIKLNRNSIKRNKRRNKSSRFSSRKRTKKFQPKMARNRASKYCRLGKKFHNELILNF